MEWAALCSQGRGCTDQADSGLRFPSSSSEKGQQYGALLLLWLHFNLSSWFCLWTSPILLLYSWFNSYFPWFKQNNNVWTFVFLQEDTFVFLNCPLLTKGEKLRYKNQYELAAIPPKSLPVIMSLLSLLTIIILRVGTQETTFSFYYFKRCLIKFKAMKERALKYLAISHWMG